MNEKAKIGLLSAGVIAFFGLVYLGYQSLSQKDIQADNNQIPLVTQKETAMNTTPTPAAKGDSTSNTTPTPAAKGESTTKATPTPAAKGESTTKATPTPAAKGESTTKATPTPAAKGESTTKATPTPVAKGSVQSKYPPAKPFQVKSMSNQKIVSLSDFKGKHVVVNFWASWCPPCREEMPHFDALAKELSNNKDITFMMVDLADGMRETEEDGANYIKENGFSFPVYFDMDSKAAMSYGIRSIPTTYFIDKAGNVQNMVIGSMQAADLRDAVNKLMASGL